MIAENNAPRLLGAAFLFIFFASLTKWSWRWARPRSSSSVMPYRFGYPFRSPHLSWPLDSGCYSKASRPVQNHS
jgi:hypothetical protein